MECTGTGFSRWLNMVVEGCGSSLLITSVFSVSREAKSGDETENGGEGGRGFRKRY